VGAGANRVSGDAGTRAAKPYKSTAGLITHPC